MSSALQLPSQKPEENPCYLGIDPGLQCTGYAVIEPCSRKPFLREGGVVKSNTKGTLTARVKEIADGIREVIEEYQPQVAAIEQIFSFGKNPQSALKLAHARGAVLLVLADHEIPVVQYSATQVKKMLTSSGRASKSQMQTAVMHELKLDEIPKPHDIADASAVALCLYHSVKFTG